jgi:hypothetical protein
MNSLHLAQINVSTALHDLDDPRMAGFVGAIDAVNAVAERSPGFVWRLKGEAGNALDLRASHDPRFIVNMSVWETAEALEAFVWQTVHAKVYARKADWFPHAPQASLALWWIEAGTVPTLDDGMARLHQLRREGDSEAVFSWAGLPSAKLWKARRCA